VAKVIFKGSDVVLTKKAIGLAVVPVGSSDYSAGDPGTTLTFTINGLLSSDSYITMELYDDLGTLVDSLMVEDTGSANTYKVVFTGHDTTSVDTANTATELRYQGSIADFGPGSKIKVRMGGYFLSAAVDCRDANNMGTYTKTIVGGGKPLFECKFEVTA
jgi:hypothetical protein